MSFLKSEPVYFCKLYHMPVGFFGKSMKYSIKKYIQSLETEIPDVRNEILAMLRNPNFSVEIHFTTETGSPVWAIVSGLDITFWLEPKKTKNQALKFCQELGWKVDKIKDYEE